jgi:hypothetical protein
MHPCIPWPIIIPSIIPDSLASAMVLTKATGSGIIATIRYFIIWLLLANAAHAVFIAEWPFLACQPYD